MRHNRSINHLGRKSGHRKAMLANMASSLILSKRIETTVEKAKALKMYVEPLITKSKEDTTHSRRVVFSYLKQKEAVSELFRVVAPKIADRPGGYTRILKTGFRVGDAADMAIMELVDFADVAVAPAKEPEKKTSTRRGGAKKAAAPAAEAAEGARCEEGCSQEHRKGSYQGSRKEGFGSPQGRWQIIGTILSKKGRQIVSDGFFCAPSGSALLGLLCSGLYVRGARVLPCLLGSSILRSGAGPPLNAPRSAFARLPGLPTALRNCPSYVEPVAARPSSGLPVLAGISNSRRAASGGVSASWNKDGIYEIKISYSQFVNRSIVCRGSCFRTIGRRTAGPGTQSYDKRRTFCGNGNKRF